jgi:hypothetical protein
MIETSSHFLKPIYPLLSECRAWIKYHRLEKSDQGAILRKMKDTKSIFVHIPKTGGKSILSGLYGIKLHEGFGHAGAGFYQSVFGQRSYMQFFKFAFVRNPWDRLYSGYKFAQQGGFGFQQDSELMKEISSISFETFVKNWLPQQSLESWTIFRPQYKFICDAEGKLLIDRICYFERIQSEYCDLSSFFNIDVTIPHVNQSLGRVSYRELYDDEMRNLVGELYNKDVTIFGYVFDGVSDNYPDREGS